MMFAVLLPRHLSAFTSVAGIATTTAAVDTKAGADQSAR